MTEAYEMFVESFAGLNPYELDHLSTMLFSQFEKSLNRALSEEELEHCNECPVDEAIIKHALTRTMQIIEREIAERRVLNAKEVLKNVKNNSYYPKKTKSNAGAFYEEGAGFQAETA